LFLDYAMRKTAELRRDASETTPPILHLADEAADIFKSPNKRLAQSMEATLDEQIRKGRSLSIGFVLSSQSAGDIPERIRHNLNSVLIFRHRQPGILRDILPEMSDATRQIAARLQPGEALVQLFKTNGLSRCRMWQSPAKLHKPRVR
jgi:DNA helicase HerA-like ATPase